MSHARAIWAGVAFFCSATFLSKSTRTWLALSRLGSKSGNECCENLSVSNLESLLNVPREKAFTQGAERYKPDAEFLERGDQILLLGVSTE